MGGGNAGFLNALVAQLWPNICVAGAQMIKNIAEPMFGTMLPAPLNTLQFTKIDLGHVPLTFANVDVHRTENEGIKLDMDLTWDGVCDIELKASKIPKIVTTPEYRAPWLIFESAMLTTDTLRASNT